MSTRGAKRMSLIGQAGRFATCAMLVALSGCYAPAHASHARLHISDSNALTFQSENISLGQLQQAVASEMLKRHSPSLVVEIDPSSKADIKTVVAAVNAIKQSHATVAFTAVPER